MQYKITEKCTSCGSCISICPTGAIKEINGVYSIKKEDCTSCGACAAVCSQDAIIEES